VVSPSAADRDENCRRREPADVKKRRVRLAIRGEQPPSPARGRCQSKFYTACSRTGAGRSSTVFAHELPTRSAGFGAENRLYLFALTVPAFSRRAQAEGPAVHIKQLKVYLRVSFEAGSELCHQAE
jgi:hypothetical protein